MGDALIKSGILAVMIKKLFYALPLCAILAMLNVSCVKDNLREVEPLIDLGPDSESEVTSLLFSVEPFRDESGNPSEGLTKTSISTEGQFTWAADDFVGIYPDSGCQIYFSMEAGAGTSSAVFDGGGWSLKSTAQYWSYYPFQADYYLEKTDIKVSYPVRTQNGNNNTAHLGSEDFMYTPKAGAIDGAVTFKYKHLSCILRPIVTLPAGTYSKIVISAGKDIFATSGSYDLTAESPAIVGDTFTNQLTINLDGVTFTEETKFTGYLMAIPVDVTDEPINVVIYSEDEPVYYYSYLRNRPWAAGSRHALECSELHRVVSSTESANAAFEAGETEIVFMEVPDENVMNFVLPPTTEDVSIVMPTTEKDCTISLEYSSGNKPENISLQAPVGANVNLDTPNSTVTLNGAEYGTVLSKTADNTLIISEGVSVNEVKLVRGNVIVYGTVESFNTDDLEEGQHPSVYVYGTVADFVDDDDVDFIIPATAICLSESELELVEGDTAQLVASFTPANANPAITWSTDNPSVAIVSETGLVTAVAPGTCGISATVDGIEPACCSITVIDRPAPEMVDLGLSVKWATCNLGATKPEEYGGYYQWAGTEDVTDTNIDLNFKHCPYNILGSMEAGWTKYIPSNYSSYWSGTGDPDNKTVLDPEDDVANVKLGGKWRMPTREEFLELKDTDNCTWTWTSINDVNGYKVSSKITGYTDNWIFLPAAGYRSNKQLFYVGSEGEYWSSSLYTGDPTSAYEISVKSDKITSPVSLRCLGLSVRPVSDEGVIHVTSISLNKSSVTLSEGSSETLTATIYPSNAINTNVTWSSDYPYVATVDANGLVTAFRPGVVTITAKTQDGGYTATCNVSINVTEVTGGEMIDLGLPSGIKWAARNLDAGSPEDFGGLYQWAGLEDETDASTSLNWNNCPYHTGSSTSPGWTKYIPSNKSSLWSGPGSPDNKTILDPEDDVAHVKLGGSWRMPTKEDFEELIKNCTSEWIPMCGFYGRKFTSKNNGNSIFLPAAGYRPDYSYRSSEGFEGYYWSSSLNTDYPIHAYPLNFTSDGVIILYDYRYLGLSVRPVCE